MKGTIIRLELSSPSLEGNALGDPAERAVWVYLPPGYEEGQERYPTAYFLHPFTGTGASWTNSAAFTLSVPERIDALVARGQVPPLVAVFPDGATRLGGTQWNNSPGMGRYQDYIANDVVPLVDRTFRTQARPSARAVLGRSSGGYGALLLGRDRPDVFAHVASNAGDAFFEYCYLPDFPKAATSYLKAGGVEPWYRDFLSRVYQTKLRADDPPAVIVLAMAASYSPNPGAPLGVDLPFEPETARIRPEVFARWLEQDPVRFVRSHASSMRKLRTVHLDCGTRDEFNMRWGTRMVAAGLRAERVEVLHEEFDDGHSGTNYRFDQALLALAPRLAQG